MTRAALGPADMPPRGEVDERAERLGIALLVDRLNRSAAREGYRDALQILEFSRGCSLFRRCHYSVLPLTRLSSIVLVHNTISRMRRRCLNERE
mmetsp:Transcript_27231/g.82685  ORF Transcript_27231/g.82685 Transcript_27231/m.82685 type:complete len:94 (+) Transcript_27231:1476-1757(+)|eukprot:scaffold18052_cov28-Tisochrysis_lutea.AAC.1